MGNCGLCCRKFKNRVGNMRRKKVVLLLVGLDNAGKTTAARGLIGEDQTGIVPTVGFSAMTLQHHQGYAVVIYDLGGGPQIRGIWPQYFVDAHGIIFIVDSSDVARLDESRKVLEDLLAHEKLSGKPVLLLANKQDKPGALDEIDVVERLNVEGIVNKYKCPTFVETCSALAKDTSKRSRDQLDPGIRNGYKWLLSMIIKEYTKFDSRVERDTLAAQEILNREKEERRLRVLENQRNREDSDRSRIIPLRDGSVEIHSLDGEELTITELKDSTVALNERADQPSPHIVEIPSESKTRFIDINGDEISLVTNESNDSGMQTLVNGSFADNGNKLNSKDSVEEKEVQEVKIEPRVNGLVECVPTQDISPIFKEYSTDFRAQSAPKRSLLKKSNKTAPAPVGTVPPDFISDRRRLPPLASPPNVTMFEIAPMKRPLPARSISMSDNFGSSARILPSTVAEYEPETVKLKRGPATVGNFNEV